MGRVIDYQIDGERITKSGALEILESGGFKGEAEEILWKYHSLSGIYSSFGIPISAFGCFVLGFNIPSGNYLSASFGAVVALGGFSMFVSSLYKAISFERMIKTAVAQNSLMDDGELPEWVKGRDDLGLDKFIESD